MNNEQMTSEEAYKRIVNIVFKYEEKELSSLKDRKLNNEALNHIREALKKQDEQIEKITDLLETEWGYEGIREDVARIMVESPCNNCIELECENHGVVCPHYRADMMEADNE